MAMAEDKGEFKSLEDGQELISAISRFGLNLYKEQVKTNKDNLFMSPLSISSVMSMAYLGARGETLEEMRKTLCYEMLEFDQLHQAFGGLGFYLKRCSKEFSEDTKEQDAFQLQLANRLFLEESYTITTDFQRFCMKYYGADTESLRFRTEPEKAAFRVNSYVSENTNGKIKNIISPEMINGDTALVLVNAIYFKSEWQDCFEKRFTEESNFFVTPDETSKAQLMFQTVTSASYCYSNDLLCQVLKLPYKSRALSMFVLLPDKEKTSLEKVEGKLTEGHLNGFDSEFQEFPDVSLWFPKFKMEEQMDLTQVLFVLGMKSVFTCGVANFYRIAESPTLYVSQVLHKAFMEVNEDGTEAAAATAVMMSDGPSREPVTFRADHPFLFFIREEKTKAVLFLGRFVRPQ